MIRDDAEMAWLRSRGALIGASAVIGVACGAMHRGAGTNLESLAVALGQVAGASEVSAQSLRWEPSHGAFSDAVLGRAVLFLARNQAEETRDVWRARVRVAPEGGAIEVLDAHDLTNTPLGDDHELVVLGAHASFATRAYGQEQSITLLDVAGEGRQNKSETPVDRAMAALTNLQQTGSANGVARFDVALESPAIEATLHLHDDGLDITLLDHVHSSQASRTARLDLARGEVIPPVPGVRAEASMHLPKRFSHWAVDTLRAVPWIGPGPIAWGEDVALAARDSYRRFVFKTTGSATQVIGVADPPPPLLDTSQASVDEAHWPPPSVPGIWKSSEDGEGEWRAPDISWLRRVPGAAADAPSPFYRTYVRPDGERPYARVLLVAMDMRQLDFDMEAGVEDPEPLTGSHGTGRIPRDPSVYRRVAAAFNGAFKTEHGHYGMMVRKRVLLPPVPASATVAVFDDGRVGLGTWGADRKVGGILGVDDRAILSFRQNLDPLLDHGQVNPAGRNLWGFTLPGKGAQTERSGLCVTTSGHLLYAWGDDVSADALAKAMKMAACDYAMHLDMNPYHTGFIFAAIDDLERKKYKSQLLTPAMSIPVDRYIQYAPKDFFYVTVHEPSPPLLDGAPPWSADGGTQPPPHWMPGIWTTHIVDPRGSVELVDTEPGRSTWRLRAGTDDAPAAAPLREFAGNEAKRVIFAVGLGIATEKRPRGLATDGRLAVPIHGASDWAVLNVDDHGRLTIVSGSEASPVGAHSDLAELPVVLWEGKPVSVPAGAIQPRAAIGIGSAGRVVIARGAFASGAPLAEALLRAGCVRALLLDRGAHSTALLDRAGTASPPRSRYEESVLYAVAASLPPRGFRFEPATLVTQVAKSR